MDIESIISAANRAQQADDAGLGNCSIEHGMSVSFLMVFTEILNRMRQRIALVTYARLFRAFPSPQEKYTP